VDEQVAATLRRLGIGRVLLAEGTLAALLRLSRLLRLLGLMRVICRRPLTEVVRGVVASEPQREQEDAQKPNQRARHRARHSKELPRVGWFSGELGATGQGVSPQIRLAVEFGDAELNAL